MLWQTMLGLSQVRALQGVHACRELHYQQALAP